MDEELVTEIARVLCEVLRANESIDGPDARSGPLTPFDGPRTPSYPIDRYLQRIHRYTYCGSACLLAALIYIVRTIVFASVSSSDDLLLPARLQTVAFFQKNLNWFLN